MSLCDSCSIVLGKFGRFVSMASLCCGAFLGDVCCKPIYTKEWYDAMIKNIDDGCVDGAISYHAQNARAKLKEFISGLILRSRFCFTRCFANCTDEAALFVNVTREHTNKDFDYKTIKIDTTNSTLDKLALFLKKHIVEHIKNAETILMTKKKIVTFISFDEMFWSQIQPLTLKEKNDIDKAVTSVISNIPCSIVFTNYLYNDHQTIMKFDAANRYIRYWMSDLVDISDVNGEESEDFKGLYNELCEIQKLEIEYKTQMTELYKQLIDDNTDNNEKSKIHEDLSELQHKIYTNKQYAQDEIIVRMQNILKNKMLQCYIATLNSSSDTEQIVQNAKYVMRKLNDCLTRRQILKTAVNYIYNKDKIQHNEQNQNMAHAIINQTEIVINGKRLIKHKKKSYFNEANNALLSGTCFYDYGDGYSENIAKTDIISKYIMDCSRNEICLDLAVGIGSDLHFASNKERHEEAKNDKQPLLKLLFYVIQSNTIDPKSHVNNLPMDTFIVHADRVANIEQDNTVYVVNKDQNQEYQFYDDTYCKRLSCISDNDKIEEKKVNFCTIEDVQNKCIEQRDKKKTTEIQQAENKAVDFGIVTVRSELILL